MSWLRVHRRLIAWLAVLAMGWGVLAPALAQAVVAAVGANEAAVTLCTSTGVVRVQADLATGDDGAAAPAGDEAAAMNCPWCLLGGGDAALPAPAVGSWLAPPRDEMPPAFYRAPTVAYAWAAHPSRAPPMTA
jgi:hypothetical protein